jgi:hypothetical protein
MTDKEIAAKMTEALKDDRRDCALYRDPNVGLGLLWFAQVMQLTPAQCRAGRLASDGRIVYVDGKYRLVDDDSGEVKS